MHRARVACARPQKVERKTVGVPLAAAGDADVAQDGAARVPLVRCHQHLAAKAKGAHDVGGPRDLDVVGYQRGLGPHVERAPVDDLRRPGAKVLVAKLADDEDPLVRVGHGRDAHLLCLKLVRRRGSHHQLLPGRPVELRVILRVQPDRARGGGLAQPRPPDGALHPVQLEAPEHRQHVDARVDPAPELHGRPAPRVAPELDTKAGGKGVRLVPSAHLPAPNLKRVHPQDGVPLAVIKQEPPINLEVHQLHKPSVHEHCPLRRDLHGVILGVGEARDAVVAKLYPHRLV
mmetsp:Transcript_35496/g.84112  ORF Transcript_35496/g.84112 Transcript_35496/m.84112 type:complete len:289 (-) Transcript_35496:9406-10272(-)